MTEVNFHWVNINSKKIITDSKRQAMHGDKHDKYTYLKSLYVLTIIKKTRQNLKSIYKYHLRIKKKRWQTDSNNSLFKGEYVNMLQSKTKKRQIMTDYI